MCILGKAPLLSSTEPRSQFLDEGSAWSYCLPAGGAHLPRTLMFPPVLAEQRWRRGPALPLPCPFSPGYQWPWWELPWCSTAPLLPLQTVTTRSRRRSVQTSFAPTPALTVAVPQAACGPAGAAGAAGAAAAPTVTGSQRWMHSTSCCPVSPPACSPYKGQGSLAEGRADGMTLRLGVPHSGCRLHSLPFSSWSPRVLISVSFPSLKHFKDLYICMSSYCAKIFHRTDRF